MSHLVEMAVVRLGGTRVAPPLVEGPVTGRTFDRLRAPFWRPPAISRRWTYPLIAIVLAAGAPCGLFLLRWAMAPDAEASSLDRIVQEDLAAFLYVSLSTLVVFAACGHLLGRQADALVDLSRTDPLTGLRNIRAFEERLADEVVRAQRYHTPLSLLMADVDRLKAINDRGGHHAGNVALRAVANALRGDARQTDLAARVGGDEFALIAPNTDADAAGGLAERVREGVAAHATGVTISVGVATLGDECPDPVALLRAADAALYQAKTLGRNRVTRGTRITVEPRGEAMVDTVREPFVAGEMNDPPEPTSKGKS
jgi:diguanylate cyclase (GGDEF)-like protein